MKNILTGVIGGYYNISGIMQTFAQFFPQSII